MREPMCINIYISLTHAQNTSKEIHQNIISKIKDSSDLFIFIFSPIFYMYLHLVKKNWKNASHYSLPLFSTGQYSFQKECTLTLWNQQALVTTRRERMTKLHQEVVCSGLHVNISKNLNLEF